MAEQVMIPSPGGCRKGMNMKRLLLNTNKYPHALLGCLLALALLLTAGPARAEVFYGVDGTSIYSVDTVNGGPSTTLVTFATPLIQGATLATRPSDGMLFYLDSGNRQPQSLALEPGHTHCHAGIGRHTGSDHHRSHPSRLRCQ